MPASSAHIQTRCCIVGGGPAGMMLGFLLARKGVDVCVLEKHSDFLRDFRGDTIHPSTLELLYELNLLDEFLQRPHQELAQLTGQIGSESVTLADFRHLPTHCRFIAFMPQWDFLDFIAEHAKRYPSFKLCMQSEVTGIIQENGVTVGVRAATAAGALEIRADLTVAADGRHSTVRARAQLPVTVLGAPMDVLWMRIPRSPDDVNQALGRIMPGQIFVTINRDEYWQCALVIPKGTAQEIRNQGLPAFRERIVRAAPAFHDRVQQLQDWNQISLLTVAVDRLVRWYRPGLLCIGDAAHAMSPIGGVGINLAVQDAVAAANLLASKLAQRALTEADLNLVQRRREFPTRATQAMQVFLQNNVIRPVLGTARPLSLPLPVRLIRRFPVLRRIPARVIGMGFLPEHIQC
ncbi:MAG TPA: FAD-dependent oxidoreductase [Terriglobales bacterium]|nr:FAD-dependent oxidoreductase [Terriglobales bacterium]